MMKQDYKFLSERPRSVAHRIFRPGHLHLLALGASGLVLGFFLSATPDDAAATRSEQSALATGTVTQALALPGHAPSPAGVDALPAQPAPTVAVSSSPAPAAASPAVATSDSDQSARATQVALREHGPVPAPADARDALGQDSLLSDGEDAPGSTSAEAAPQDGEQEFAAGEWQQITVKRGDNLAQIFSRAGLSARQVYEVMQAEGPVGRLKRIMPGEVVRLRVDEDANLNELVLKIDPSQSLRIRRTAQGYTASKVEREYEVRTAHTSGVIEQSLFVSAQQAGLPDNLTMELAGIFGWDIDMALDLRQGDRFTVIYEQNYLDGKRVSDGDIIAAEFVNRGKTFRAIRYTDTDGRTSYYTPSGLSVRKAFLRTPVNFTRISSKFDLHRRHPILNRIRAHKGVDYAAPTGTPIKATGDGKIVFRGRKGGYGNVIIIRHGSRYSTLYGHMSRFNSRFKLGSTVHQGQTIGYVGASGLATGPHLHYEFRVNGVHRNPLTVDLPVATPIATLELPAFRAEADPLIAQLDTLARTQVARN